MPVSFCLDTRRADRHGEVPIRASVSVLGARITTNSGCKCDPDRWDKRRQLVRGGSNAAQINSRLGAIASFFLNYEDDCHRAGIFPSSADIGDAFRRQFRLQRSTATPTTKDPRTLRDYLNAFIQEQGVEKNWSETTLLKFRVIGRRIEEYSAGITFAAITEKWLNGYIVYLRDECQLRNSTIAKQLGFLKWFLRWATARGYNRNTTYETFSPRLRQVPPPVVFLDWDELMTVLRFDVPPSGTEVTLTTYEGITYTKTVEDAPAIEKTRDIFCLCAFTSLRYSDAQRLRLADIVDDKMTITTVKTADRLTIELNKYSREILERWKGKCGVYALPRMSNQRANGYLKTLCELCGLNKPITRTYYRGAERVDEVEPKWAAVSTHAGRRTFVCNALMMGIPAETVMKWTGHSDYKSMRPYVAVADAAKAAAMHKFDDR